MSSVDKKMNILVVDDVQFVRRELRVQLRKLGFDNIDAAENGRQALEMMRGGKEYGLVISDWVMDPMTGLELLQEIRRDSKFGKTPFIMITGNIQPEQVVAAKKAGVNGYIAKPFNVVTLKQRLESVLGPLGVPPQTFAT
jgi:two-component system, chemotaxis family, chemotaxis protein CheY